MDLERLGRSPIGQLVPVSGRDPRSGEHVEGYGFLADPLPADPELSSTAWTAVTEASAALAEANAAAALLPNPGLLRAPSLRREAQSTSALEGTYVPFDEVLAAPRGDMETVSGDLREVLNFEQMAEHAFAWPLDRRITVAMVEELQGILVRRTRSELDDAGRLRSRTVLIGSRGGGFEDARFVPGPHGDQLRDGVDAWIRWVNDPPPLPPVVQAGLAHYQFETLHPFSDGNGRLGRLLVIVQLLRANVLAEPLLVVSPWFEARRQAYQDALLELSISGDWSPWMTFFATGVAASARATRQRIDRLRELQRAFQARVHDARRKGIVERLAGDLVGRPFLTSTDVSRDLGVTTQAARNALRALEELEILRPVGLGGPGRGQLFGAPEVLRILRDDDVA